MAPKVERLVNLTIALLESRRPLTLDDLRQATGYYDQRDTQTARRMFERDKDILRGLGVPIQTTGDPITGHAAYTVERTEFELPDVALDRDEMAALALALRMTGDVDERLALSKLAARAPDPGAVPTTVNARVSVRSDAIDDLADAVVGRQAIRFAYRTARGIESRRSLDPYGVVLRHGDWYVVGRDHDRDDLRAFRLDRICGAIRRIGPAQAYSHPDGLDLAAQVAGPAGDAVAIDLAVTAAAQWAIEARGGVVIDHLDDGRTVLRIDGGDPLRLVPWVLGLGPDIEVVKPLELREAVAGRLRAIVAPS